MTATSGGVGVRHRAGRPGPRRRRVANRRPVAAGGGGDAGSVTAELAIGLVTVVTVLLLVLAVGAATVARVRCTDAARAGARVAALGESDADVRATAARIAGEGTTITVVRTGDGFVEVRVRSPVAGRGPAHDLQASAVAVARVEP